MNTHRNVLISMSYSPKWRQPTCLPMDQVGAHRPHTTCSFCGSLHPSDLARGLDAGALVLGIGFKAGAPYKARIGYLPNRFAGIPELHLVGNRKKRAPAPATVEGIFYIEHLQDASDAELALINKALHYDIRFTSDGHLHWSPA